MLLCKLVVHLFNPYIHNTTLPRLYLLKKFHQLRAVPSKYTCLKLLINHKILLFVKKIVFFFIGQKKTNFSRNIEYLRLSLSEKRLELLKNQIASSQKERSN